MRQYHHIKKTEEIKEISKMICNQCGKEIPVMNGQPREGVFSADVTWGYFSERTESGIPLNCARNAMTPC